MDFISSHPKTTRLLASLTWLVLTLPAIADPSMVITPDSLARSLSVSAVESVASGSGARENTTNPLTYSTQGADSCLACHDLDTQVMTVFKTAHGSFQDPNSPMRKLQCESCHGPSGAHSGRVRRGEERPPVPAFATNSHLPREETSAICLSCHQVPGKIQADWSGSAHQRANLVCVDCHRIHAERDPVRTKTEQARVCNGCHIPIRAEGMRPFTHPVREGLMTCTDCHQPHGSLTPGMLNRPTLNETCYRCHAGKRGPLLWEHPPVVENCLHCHEPHGALHRGLLNQRAPLLCQACHSRFSHPGMQQSGAGLAPANASPLLLAGSCLNCHSQIHGSNHPGGASLSR